MHYRYPATVLHIHDGDSWHFLIDQGLDTTRKLKVRLYGIDTPELNTQEGKDIRDLLRLAYPVGTSCEIITLRDKQEKYGRYLATVMINGVSINGWLIEKGFAKPFMMSIDKDNFSRAMGIPRYSAMNEEE